jgi:hypothetical protein
MDLYSLVHRDSANTSSLNQPVQSPEKAYILRAFLIELVLIAQAGEEVTAAVKHFRLVFAWTSDLQCNTTCIDWNQLG